ncbi:hypothetical protein F6X40_41320 [Paraburkholderia sp. UCT31]|uniref:hypothetical protein n=1 Tax=Paraburkholderia sp. UCT31 TaxID=2615209 RepID=UPI001655CC6D|nr:hypothetical protein [Paraburkholderia sp. UCT31]MBC8742906.1 hypothetical protein [Paraburkholderia sp. UCT31]
MNFRALKPKLLALALAATFSGGAFASMSNVGSPDEQVPLLKTYGMDVPAKTGLRTVLPQGWTLYIHKAVHLPDSMSWKAGDPWMRAIEDLADQNNLAIKLDWHAKTVTIEPPDVALKEQAKVQQIQNAATTPLPAYAPDTPAASVQKPTAPVASQAVQTQQPSAADVSAPGARPARSLAEKIADLKAAAARAPAPVAGATSERGQTSALPVGATSPTGAPSKASTNVATNLDIGVVNKQMGSSAGLMPASAAPPVAGVLAPSTEATRSPLTKAILTEAAMPRNGALSQVGGSLKGLLERVAELHGYTLSWDAPDARIPGAVTVLGVDPGEDAKLLQRAMGERDSPVAIEVYRSSNVYRVVPRSTRSEAVSVIDVPFSGPIANRASPAPYSVATAPDASGPQSVRSATNQATPPVAEAIPATVAPAAVKLTVLKGDSLSNSLKSFFRAQGWDMQWKASTDMQAEYPVSLEGRDAQEILSKLLPKLGLVADFYNPSKLAVIRPVDSSVN